MPLVEEDNFYPEITNYTLLVAITKLIHPVFYLTFFDVHYLNI